MGKWDQGLTAFGLLVFGAILAAGVPIGWAYVFASEAPKAADWLGFAGNTAAAMFTLIAAIVAWRAVQRQIDVQRDANLLTILTREEDRLEAEVRAVELCIMLLLGAQQARRELDVAKYYARLKDAGIVEDQQQMREVVRKRIGDPVPLGLIDITAYPLARLMNSLLNCIYENHETAPDGHVVYKPTLNGAVTQAEHHLDSAGITLNDTLTTIERRLAIYRERIEIGLSEMRHNAHAPKR